MNSFINSAPKYQSCMYSFKNLLSTKDITGAILMLIF